MPGFEILGASLIILGTADAASTVGSILQDAVGGNKGFDLETSFIRNIAKAMVVNIAPELQRKIDIAARVLDSSQSLLLPDPSGPFGKIEKVNDFFSAVDNIDFSAKDIKGSLEQRAS